MLVVAQVGPGAPDAGRRAAAGPPAGGGGAAGRGHQHPAAHLRPQDVGAGRRRGGPDVRRLHLRRRGAPGSSPSPQSRRLKAEDDWPAEASGNPGSWHVRAWSAHETPRIALMALLCVAVCSRVQVPPAFRCCLILCTSSCCVMCSHPGVCKCFLSSEPVLTCDCRSSKASLHQTASSRRRRGWGWTPQSASCSRMPR